uniref:cyclic nucleotide-binding domain-containing protein n=1 Tax=Petrachloros mirabilis TaxID=2918835 RepID=UPI00308457D6
MNLVSGATIPLAVIPTESTNWLVITGLSVLSVALILTVAWGADWLLDRLFEKLQSWGSKSLASSYRSWFELGRSFLKFGLRLGVWILAGYVILLRVPILQPVATWFTQGLRTIPTELGIMSRAPLFTLGRNRISLGTLILFLVAALLIFLSAGLLSQWLKRRILVRINADRGTQEAIAAIIGYTLALIGLLVLLQSLGLDLSSLAVFAGVIGLGIGFSLQQLASHFVSGITLLFEQQLRVGDFIDIEGVLGTIERISIRSTIVRTQDRRFVIVPNHLFFEQKVINWSYQTPESRIHLPVNVAYGSDTVLVTETLLSAARMDPRVLRYPTPQVWFKRFGESAYEFELLVWINQPPEFEPIKSALYFLIEQELHQRGIEVPFPQRDLHLRNPEMLQSMGLVGQHRDASLNSDAVLSTTGETPTQKPTLAAKGMPNSKTLRVLLRQVSYFEKCTNAQLRVLIEQGYRKFLATGQIVCREQEPGESFYIILTGQVEVVSEKLGQAIAILSDGNFFGEISLLTGAPRSATVRTITDTILFVVDRSALQLLLKNHQGLAEEIARALCQRQQVLQELGLFNPNALDRSDDAPFIWIRRRLQTLFGI